MASGGNVFNIAEGLRRNEGPFSLRYTPLSALIPLYTSTFGISAGLDTDTVLQRIGRGVDQDVFTEMESLSGE